MKTKKQTSPSRAPRRASVDQARLRRVLDLHFTPDGKTSPALQKCVTHFKDRFKEVVGSLEASSLGKASRPKTQTVTADKGCDVTLEVEWSGPFLEEDIALWRNLLKVKVDRLLSPTMKSTGFVLNADRTKMPDVDSLANSAEGFVGAELIPSGNKLFLTAAMLFHHPSDKYVLADEDTAFPDNDLTMSDGTNVRFSPSTRNVVIIKPGYILGSGRTQTFANFAKTTEATSEAHLILEVAQSRGSTYESMKALLRRMGIKAHEITMHGSDAEVVRMIERTRELAGLRVWKYLEAELGLSGGAMTHPRPERWFLEAHIDMEGAGEVFVEVQIDAQIETSEPLTVRIEGSLNDARYGELRYSDRVYLNFRRAKDAPGIDVTDPDAPALLFRAAKPELDQAISTFRAAMTRLRDRVERSLAR